MSGSLFVTPRFRALSVSGGIPGAKLWFYQAGTSVLAPTYTGAALTVEHTNPVIADAGGEFLAIYLDPAVTYKAVLQTADGEQIWAEDNIPAGVASSGAGTDTGPPGDDGLSVAELTIYQRADDQPNTPSGGSFSFTTQSLDAPDGWSVFIPEGTAPVWASKAVAAVEGPTGTDAVLDWSVPVRVLSDGASVDIVFRRYATQPPTPAPSSGVPADWYTDVDSVPASSDKLWSSVGTRAHAGENWVWQLPIQVEGNAGPAGADASLYYIKPTSGTAIKNSSGSLRLEAHQLFGGNDVLLSSGTVKLYVGSTEVTVANGYGAGSTGYVGVFNSANIAGSVVVTLKNGAAGTALDTITLVDVVDGSVGGVGTDAVYGYIEADGPLAWVRASDGTTWTPSDDTLQFDCTFVQGGADVARVAHVLTRASDGTITGAAGTHSGGDLNGSRVTVTELNEGTTVMGVKFDYSYSGDESSVAETAYSSLSGTDGTPGATGPTGPAGYSLQLTRRVIPLQAYQNGLVTSYANANGIASLWQGDTDVTAATTFSISASSNVSGATINTAADTPTVGQPIGYYAITALNADVGSITVSAVHDGNTITETVQFSRSYVGYEIVTSLPNTNNFEGRVVYLTTDDKLYRYTGSAWTRAVDGADLVANSVTTNSINTGAVTAAKISVTSLSSLSANLGTVTAGVAQSPTGNSRFDFNNARIIFNTNPGATGGFVRISGVSFGPSSNYIEWYGAKPAGQSTDAGIVGALTDSGAKMLMKTDGSSMFAGRIRGEFEPKAWVSFDGNTSPATMLDRYNVASVTRPSTGTYTLTFAEALANANYVVSGTCQDGTASRILIVISRSTTAVTVRAIGREDGNAKNCDYVGVLIFGSNVPAGSNVTTPSGGTGGGTIGGGYLPGSSVLP